MLMCEKALLASDYFVSFYMIDAGITRMHEPESVALGAVLFAAGMLTGLGITLLALRHNYQRSSNVIYHGER